MKNLIEETGLNEMNHQQGMKPYGSIKLTVYGKMVKLTAAGSNGTVENGNCNSGSTNCRKP